MFSCLSRQTEEESGGGGPEVDTVSGSSPVQSSAAATSRYRDGADAAISGCRQSANTVRTGMQLRSCVGVVREPFKSEIVISERHRTYPFI